MITGNKALLAAHGAELYAAADAAGVDLLFEAAVAGGIPLMRPLRESLVGEPVTRVMGIINGTTNYILTRMTEAGASYEEALAEAQALGYAEEDPTADVEGYDAGAKAAIIATIVYGAIVSHDDVYHEGISSITAEDIDVARRLGYAIKAIAIIEGGSADRPERRRAGAPRAGAARPSAGVGARQLQCGLHRGRGRGRPHVLRTRRRWCARPHRPCSAT